MATERRKIPEEVRDYGKQMAVALERKMEQYGETWRDLSDENLLKHLHDEVEELEDAITRDESTIEIIQKAAGVGNLAMFLYWNHTKGYK